MTNTRTTASGTVTVTTVRYGRINRIHLNPTTLEEAMIIATDRLGEHEWDIRRDYWSMHGDKYAMTTYHRNCGPGSIYIEVVYCYPAQ